MALRIFRRHFTALAASGDPALPRAFWEMLYPYGWRSDVTAAAQRAGIDPFLVAAIVMHPPVREVAAGLVPRGADHHPQRIAFTLTDARVKSGPRTGTSAGVLIGRPFGTGAVTQRVTVTSVAGPVVRV